MAVNGGGKMSRRPIGEVGFVSNSSGAFREIVYHLGSAYERCNLWPAYESSEDFLEILGEEVRETYREASKMAIDVYDDLIKNESGYNLEIMRGMAIKVMLEAVQVVSVLDKYEACKPRELLAEEKPNE